MNTMKDGEMLIVEKARLNIWNLGGFIVGITVTAFGWGVTYTTLTSSIQLLKEQVQQETQSRKDGVLVNDSRLKTIENKIPQFEVIALQIQRLTELSSANEKAIEETNARINRVVESQSGKLDSIITRVSDLTTEIRVVQSQLKDFNVENKRTRFPAAWKVR